jgi:Zn-dependent protease
MMESLGENFQRLSIQLPPFIMAVVFHEFAHGFIANRWGDTTARDRGRLTLNPIPHIDPVGTLLFPIINMLSGMSLLIGWAKPVPIDPRKFRRLRLGLFCVSLAGVGMNVLLALLSACVLMTIYRFMPHDFFLFDPLFQMCIVSISLNYALAVFNMIPLPPLDGSKVVESFLPIAAARKFESISRYSFFILMALLLSGAFSVLAYPIRLLTNLTLLGAAALFHLPLNEVFS